MSEQPAEPGEPVPDLEEILRRSQGIDGLQDSVIEAMTAVHARWFRAWQETGAFSEDQAFELTRVLVATAAGGLRSLGLS